MNQFNITGMSCSACSAKVEKSVSKVNGVKSCSVNLLTNSMNVEGTASSVEIIKAVTNAGYGASEIGKANNKNNATDYDGQLKDTQTPKIRNRLIASICLLVPLMYFSMGHTMWNWPLPSFFDGNHIAMGLVQLLLSTAIIVINQKFFINGFKGLIHLAPNMDTLVSLGSAASYLYSVYALFEMTNAQIYGNSEAVMSYMHEFYFESAAMILTLITLGKMLESHSKGKTTDAIKGLMKLAPKTAVLLRDNVKTEVLIDEVKVGDIFVVKPGESIPVDGTVIDGESAVNESALTGESIPVDKTVGNDVSAATINQSGFITCKATKVGDDTSLSQIIKMVSNAAATKAPIAKIADKVSGIFVPTVIGIAVVTFLIWIIAGQAVGYSLARAISVLVISCPCALGLATPVAIMVGNGKGAKNGILFKTAEALETTGKIQIVALDKTGTITIGEPVVTDIIASECFNQTQLLTVAASLEEKSEHPLAKAIMKKANENNIKFSSVENFKALPGNGLTGTHEDIVFNGGNINYIMSKADVSDELKDKANQLSEEGKTPIFFSCGNVLAGIIAVSDVIKKDSPKAVKELQNMGIKVVMLTGDNERTANAIGSQAGVDEVIAGVLPDGKEAVIKKLKTQGNVAMVGDGINDAPALMSADIGIAIGAGTDIAIDAADIVLMKNELTDVPAAIRMSHATLRNIHENLFWAFFYNVIGIPLAAGLWIPIFGWTLNPMFGAAAMSLSSFCVVTNALRLNWFKLYDSSKDKRHSKIRDNNKPDKVIADEITITVGGMMCSHCENSVKDALESLDGVTDASANHESGKAVIHINSQVKDKDIKKAIEKVGYKVIEINK